MVESISVIIPVHNGAAFVGEAIETALHQRVQPTEIIVIDDGSTDATPSVLRTFGSAIRCVRKPNGGPASARNLGLSMAHGDVIAFLDADDTWPTSKLAIQSDMLGNDPSRSIVIGHTQFVAQQLGGTPAPVGSPVPQLLLGSALFRRTVFAEVGVFDESLRFADDWDWFMRAREHGLAFELHPDVVLRYRKHHSNITRKAESQEDLFRLLRLSLDRRRKAVSHSSARSLPRLFPSEPAL